MKAARRTSAPSRVRQRRRCEGLMRSSRHARTAPPAGSQGPGAGLASAVVVVVAVVATVRVAVPEAVPVIETGVVAPKLRVGALTAPAGEVVTAAVRATLPVNPPLGVTVRVEVFPVVAPAATVTAVPESFRPGVEVVEVTVTETGAEVEPV